LKRGKFQPEGDVRAVPKRKKKFVEKIKEKKKSLIEEKGGPLPRKVSLRQLEKGGGGPASKKKKGAVKKGGKMGKCVLSDIPGITERNSPETGGREKIKEKGGRPPKGKHPVTMKNFPLLPV